MLENISLISSVHKGLSRKESQDKAYKALSLLGLENIASLRYNECSAKERFCVQLIRADTIKDTTIIIEQPFALLSQEEDLGFVIKLLTQLNISLQRVYIIDLVHQENYYKEHQCLIEK